MAEELKYSREEPTYQKCIRLGRSHQVRVEIRSGALHCWPEMANQWAHWGGKFKEEAFRWIDNAMFQYGENFEKHRALLEAFVKLSSPCFFPVAISSDNEAYIKQMLEPYPNTERFRW